MKSFRFATVLAAVLSAFSFRRYALAGSLWDGEPTAGAGAAGAAGAAGGSSASAGSTAGTQSPGAPGAAAAGIAGAGGDSGTGGRKVFEYPEDRSSWVPPSRMRETHTKYETERQRSTRLEGELAAEKRRVAALAGVNPQSAEEADDEALKAAFYAKFPHLKKFEDLDVDALKKMLSSGDAAGDVVRNHWDNHAARIFDSAAAQIEQALNMELTERQFNRMVSQFREYSKTQPDAEAFRLKYERSDPTVVAEFVKEFLEDWVEPVRRTAAAGITGRPRVPAGGFSRPVTRVEPQKQFANPEEAEDAGVQYMRDRGLLAGASS